MTALIRAPLCGEVLGADDAVTVIAALHPTSPSRETLTAPAGLSIAEIVDLALAHRPVGMRRSVRVSIGADPVPEALWRSVRPRARTVVVLRAVPGSGAGGLFRAIAMLAVAILTAFVAPYLTPILGTIGTILVTTAITVGAGLLLNALFPVNAKKADTGQVYSIAGNQNLATPYQPIPMLHGTTRVYPRYAGSAYSEFEGDNQILRLLYLWGYAPIDVTKLRLGETPLDTFRDVEVETFDVHPGGPQPTLYPMTVVQRDLNIEVKQVDGWTTRTTSDDCTEWALDFGCPNGLSATKASGDVIVLTVQIAIEQSVAYAEDWQPVQTLTLAAASNRPIRVTVRRPVESGTYDIRWRRLTPDTEGNPKLISATVVTAMRSYKAGTPITFGKPVTVTALRIRATSQISGIVDNLNAVCTGRLRAWNGSAWVDSSVSSNPADQLVRVLQGPANARPIADARIDWTTIQEWHAWCAPRGYRYDKLHTERQSVLDTAQDIASAGRAAVLFRADRRPLPAPQLVGLPREALLPAAPARLPDQVQEQGSRLARRRDHRLRRRLQRSERDPVRGTGVPRPDRPRAQLAPRPLPRRADPPEAGRLLPLGRHREPGLHPRRPGPRHPPRPGLGPRLRSRRGPRRGPRRPRRKSDHGGGQGLLHPVPPRRRDGDRLAGADRARHGLRPHAHQRDRRHAPAGRRRPVDVRRGRA
jgi:hypothetical protein